MFWTESLWMYLLGIIVAFTAICITKLKRKFAYWKIRNVPYLEPSFPFGNLQNPFKVRETVGISVKRLYDELKSKKLPHGGVFFLSRPIYLLADLESIKNVLTKDFQYFFNRGVYYNEKDDPISAHLFAIGGQRWRNLRMKLTPTFTSGKMKLMFQTLLDCQKNLHEKIALLCESKQPIDIKELLGCYTTDVIGSCAFGLECNTFKDDDSPFRKYGKKVFGSNISRRLQISFAVNFPKAARAFKIRAIPKDISDFFSKVVKDNVEYREKNNFRRNDFMQLLIDLKNNKLVTIEEVTAQSFVFFLAGFETSSTAMTFALYELAKNQDIQQKVRDEISTVLAKHDGKVTYDAIKDMTYMNQVLDETLRKYPPVPILSRECVRDYRIPGEDMVIEKGTRILVPVLGIHYDEEYYPNPEKFDPERFDEENSKNRQQYSYIPFGEGPRICIGLRFGIMQSKVELTSLLQKYKFTLNDKTKQPMKFAKNSFILAVEGDVWLDAEKL
ncbi:hypothetical protein Zmor_017644 [Zophobas morio]|uniref:Cytochrome P450 n=1 Tax=Zophobas morio TaxID=2755281 RepID=A0AA38I8T5_9CUCU|nr:hypothetical protein Zmor_017644 [Zophobas morio]